MIRCWRSIPSLHELLLWSHGRHAYVTVAGARSTGRRVTNVEDIGKTSSCSGTRANVVFGRTLTYPRSYRFLDSGPISIQYADQPSIRS